MILSVRKNEDKIRLTALPKSFLHSVLNLNRNLTLNPNFREIKSKIMSKRNPFHCAHQGGRAPQFTVTALPQFASEPS